MMPDWINSTEKPFLKWVRIPTKKNKQLEMVFLNYTDVEEVQFKHTTYLLFDVMFEKDYNEIGVQKDIVYRFSIPKISWVEAWKLYVSKPQFEKNKIYNLKIKFLRFNKVTIKINNVEVMKNESISSM